VAAKNLMVVVNLLETRDPTAATEGLERAI
jgi:hypothetical protein